MLNQQLFFTLIQIAVGRQERFDEAPTPEAWQKMFAEAGRQAIAGVLFSAVERLPQEQRPPREVLLRWYAMKEKIVKRNMRVTRCTLGIMRRLERDGMRPCLLKGQGMAMLYADPMLRQPGDIDIWADVPKQQTIEYAHRHCRTCGPVCPHHIDFPVMGDVDVELHFVPATMMNPLLNRRLKAFFRKHADAARKNMITLSDMTDTPSDKAGSVAVPTAAFNSVFLLVHTFKHFISEGVGMRQLNDYYQLLTSDLTDVDRREVAYMIRKLHLTKFAGAVMYVMRTVFGLEEEKFIVDENAKEGEVLLGSVMEGGNFGKFACQKPQRESSSHIMKFLRSLPHSLRLLRNYPAEVSFAPLYNIYFFFHLRWYRQ